MTVCIIDTAASYTFGGTEKFVPLLNGYPVRGLGALYRFQENTGTSLADTLGGSAGLIEHPSASNNAYSWLGAGELRLEGTEIATFPAIDVTSPFSLAYIFEVTGSVGGTGSERITALCGFRDFTGSPNGIRGVLLYFRGGTNWSGASTLPYFQTRPGNGSGSQGTLANLLPATGLTTLDQRLLAVLSYDGSALVTATIYDATGQTVATVSFAINDTQMTTGTAGNVDTTLQPMIGGPTVTYNGGQQTALGFAVYNRVLGTADIAALTTLAASL